MRNIIKFDTVSKNILPQIAARRGYLIFFSRRSLRLAKLLPLARPEASLDFIFLDPDGMGRKDSIGQVRFTGLTRFFSPSARSPFGRRPFYPYDLVDPV